jgi:hypothetical protein
MTKLKWNLDALPREMKKEHEKRAKWLTALWFFATFFGVPSGTTVIYKTGGLPVGFILLAEVFVGLVFYLCSDREIKRLNKKGLEYWEGRRRAAPGIAIGCQDGDVQFAVAKERLDEIICLAREDYRIAHYGDIPEEWHWERIAEIAAECKTALKNAIAECPSSGRRMLRRLPRNDREIGVYEKVRCP